MDLSLRTLNYRLKTFQNVKVFVGDNFHIAANASYKNLVWENIPWSAPVYSTTRSTDYNYYGFTTPSNYDFYG